VDFSHTVGSYIRTILNERGLLPGSSPNDLSQKELWTNLGLRRSHEFYRRIVFEDHHPTEYDVYEELAAALSIDPQPLLLLAVVNSAPAQVRRVLQTSLATTGTPRSERWTSRLWTVDSLADHVTSLYLADGFEIHRDLQVKRIKVPLTMTRTGRLSEVVHRVWILPHAADALPSSRRFRTCVDEIRKLRDLGYERDHYFVLVLGGVSIPGLDDVPAYIDILTPGQFDAKYFEATRYLQSLLEWHKQPEAEHYIDLPCTVRPGPQRMASESIRASEAFERWLDSDSSLLVVTGGFGTGKSTFLNSIAARLAESRINQTSPLIPLLVRLRNYRGRGWKNLIQQTIPSFMEEQLGVTGASRSWQSLIDHGPFVVLLDALDEYSATFSRDDYQACQLELSSVTSERKGEVRKPKMVLSVRAEMFPDNEEMRRFLEPVSPNHWLLKMQPLQRNEIKTLLNGFLKHRNGGPGDGENSTSFDRICRLMAQESEGQDAQIEHSSLNRPLIVRIVSQNWTTLSSLGNVTTTALHEAVVEEWISREQSKGRDPLRTIESDNKRLWLYWLAERIEHSESGLRLHFHAFPGDICRQLRFRNAADLDAALEHEVRTSSFLERTEGGEYFFAHRSFAQYCFAKRVSEQITSGTRNLFGLQSLSNKSDLLVRRFLVDICGNTYKQTWVKRLTDWLHESRQPKYYRLGNDRYTSANALLILALLQRGDLKGIDLSRIYLGDSSLSRAIVGHVVDLRQANLSASQLSRIEWHDVDLREATIKWTWFHDCSIDSSTAPDTNASRIIVTGDSSGYVTALQREVLSRGEPTGPELIRQVTPPGYFLLPGGRYPVGAERTGQDRSGEFSHPKLDVWLDPVFVAKRQVINSDFQAFLHSPDGRDWTDFREIRVKTNAPYFLYSWDAEARSPRGDGTDSPFFGPVLYISFKAATDFASSSGGRLPTEFEYEASTIFAAVSSEAIRKRISEKLTWKNFLQPKDDDPLSEGFQTLTREWCLDYFARDYQHHVKGDLVNPFTWSSLPLLTHSEVLAEDELRRRYEREENRVLRGFRESEFTPVYFREPMEPTNVNPDVGFRVVIETWIALASRLADV
jgi:hypothetical protein